MKVLSASTLFPGVLAVLGAAILAVWIGTAGVDDLQARIPGLDRPEGFAAVEPPPAPVAGEPIVSDVKPSELAGDWPCFRGPERDGIDHQSVPLARKWPDGGPKILWNIELGPGHAGAAVAEGCIYVLDYDEENEADTMRCLSLADGREVWRNSYPVEVVENHGMSRCVPAAAEGCVVSIGPKCHAACWDAKTGECRWLLDMVREYHTSVPEWYTGQCPLIDNGRVILAPSGDALLVAVDLLSGAVVWESPKVANWEMTHVSVMATEEFGRRMYVYCGSRGVAGVSADDGSLLWQSTDWVGKMATCPTPIAVGDGRIFFSGGYKAGSLMLKLNEIAGQIVPETLFRLDYKQFDSEQQTPILFDGHLYGVRTLDAGAQLVCADLNGRELWNSGREKFGRGPYLMADGLLYVLSDRGLLTMVEATPDGYRPLESFQAIEHARDAWAPMAMAAGRLILRDATRMVCLDVAEK